MYHHRLAYLTDIDIDNLVLEKTVGMELEKTVGMAGREFGTVVGMAD